MFLLLSDRVSNSARFCRSYLLKNIYEIYFPNKKYGLCSYINYDASKLMMSVNQAFLRCAITSLLSASRQRNCRASSGYDTERPMSDTLASGYTAGD